MRNVKNSNFALNIIDQTKRRKLPQNQRTNSFPRYLKGEVFDEEDPLNIILLVGSGNTVFSFQQNTEPDLEDSEFLDRQR